MINILKHFIPWLVIPTVIYYYIIPATSEEMFIILFIAFISVVFIIYITNILKRMIPVAIIGVVLSTLIYSSILM